MGLLDPSVWTGKVFSGDWVAPAGGERAVVEPATGEELGRVGVADAEDVARATGLAAQAQPGWAAASHEERARVLRQAGALWGQHAGEVRDWLVREAGSIPPRRMSRSTAPPTSASRRPRCRPTPTGGCCRPPRSG
jgi:benzaldehyde dehydrogenase (NAD)